MALGAGREQLGQHVRGEHLEAPDRDRAGEFLPELAGLGLQLLGLGQQPAGGGQQLLAGRGERDPARVVAQQQLHLQDTFQVGQRGRHGRLRQVHPGRRAGDAAGLGDRDEVLQLAQRVLGHRDPQACRD